MNQTSHLPLVAILRGILPHEVDDHIHELIEAGFSSIEIPLNSPDWQVSIQKAVTTFGKKALIGAGTVLNTKKVDELSQLGCQLIVTPNTNPLVIKRAIEHGMAILPGCATATEAFAAIDAGASRIKLFPSNVFGPDYIRALKSVLPSSVEVYCVGGVTPEKLPLYLHAGCTGAGLGSDLYKAGQSPEITRARAQAFVASYQQHTK